MQISTDRAPTLTDLLWQMNWDIYLMNGYCL